jgi:adhesin transport system membrane fusion protein
MVTFSDEFESRTKGPSLLIWLIGATVFIFLLWAKFAAIDEIVRAKGSIVSSSRP